MRRHLPVAQKSVRIQIQTSYEGGLWLRNVPGKSGKELAEAQRSESLLRKAQNLRTDFTRRRKKPGGKRVFILPMAWGRGFSTTTRGRPRTRVVVFQTSPCDLLESTDHYFYDTCVDILHLPTSICLFSHSYFEERTLWLFLLSGKK